MEREQIIETVRGARAEAGALSSFALMIPPAGVADISSWEAWQHDMLCLQPLSMAAAITTALAGRADLSISPDTLRALESRLSVALQEIAANLLWHDLAGLPGAAAKSESLQRRVERLETARGVRNTISWRITPERLEVTVYYNRPFDFNERWQALTPGTPPMDYDTEYEEHGLGLFLIRNAFDDATGYPEERRIEFWLELGRYAPRLMPTDP